MSMCAKSMPHSSIRAAKYFGNIDIARSRVCAADGYPHQIIFVGTVGRGPVEPALINFGTRDTSRTYSSSSHSAFDQMAVGVHDGMIELGPDVAARENLNDRTWTLLRYFAFFTRACAAASRAIGTRYGEHDT